MFLLPPSEKAERTKEGKVRADDSLLGGMLLLGGSLGDGAAIKLVLTVRRGIRSFLFPSRLQEEKLQDSSFHNVTVNRGHASCWLTQKTVKVVNT